MITRVYQGVTLIASIILLPIFMLVPRGRKRILERYGFWNLEAKDVVWFHGASVGEINGILPVIRKCRERYPNARILVTATSVTGLEKAASEVDFVRLLPFDHPLWIRRALKDLQISFFAFGETELWPSLIHFLAEREVPQYLINARISKYSAAYYKYLKGLFGTALKEVSLILAADSESQVRFLSLGLPPSKVELTGNAKYDLRPTVESAEATVGIRKLFFGNSAPVVTLGSLRPGEEDAWFQPIAEAIKKSTINVVIAPRHLEKVPYFADKLDKLGVSFVKWSERKLDVEALKHSSSPRTEEELLPRLRVILLDTMGELEKVYSFSTLAFIGGTLVDWGGHNPLEAAAYGACIAVGPHTSNIDEVLQSLRESGDLELIRNASDALNVLNVLANAPAALAAKGKRAYDVWKTHTGASQRIVDKFPAGALNG